MPIARRRFLVLSGLVPAAALAACTDTATGGAGPEDRGELPTPDLDAMEFLAGLEVVAESAYRDALAAATAGKLGEVPAAGMELIQSAAAQHGQCLSAINDLLKTGRRAAASDANVEFQASTVTTALVAAKNWAEVAPLIRTIETALAATYLQSIHSTLQSRAALHLAGGIQATGQKRVAVLNFLLGEYPVPDTFQKTDAALRA